MIRPEVSNGMETSKQVLALVLVPVASMEILGVSLATRPWSWSRRGRHRLKGRAFLKRITRNLWLPLGIGFFLGMVAGAILFGIFPLH